MCAYSLRKRLPELAPWIMATLMSILAFFCILMLFAANPFSVVAAGVPPDGEGLNPLLQNYWMMIHPPMLYIGMVGWAVPFAFAFAALITGRLENDWVLAVRRFTLFAFIALAVGNTLGMLWSYEELGWGGYWAWDPVENAAFMPLLAGTPLLHSVMLQERRGMFKVWNVFLFCLTFLMTIFGTFLTRSGMIASVHSFARSSIGIYFVWYMCIMVAACVGLIVWRLPLLRSRGRIDSLLSRDFVFLLNNWILMGMLFFVLIATTFPLISEALRGETVTVGPGYYNKWMVPLGLVLMTLTGIGPLLAWRKSTRAQLWRVMLVPSVASLVMLIVHVFIGPSAGFPAYVTSDQIYDTGVGRALALVYGCAPVLSTTICTFVVVGHLQEFWRGTRVRMRNAGEGFFTALLELVTRAKRRYGGYLVHLGLVAMYFGFTGSAYDVDKEAALRPGQSLEVRGFTIRYDGSRMEVD
ncbi:MAG TPA: cytochrome c-type biogenesis CcmF C-terminal domain-containing protein, partial [Polyangiales bacterium]|nr:cytochrome c-type biogenesis CcmF C-terminal domain-containing protein [Polyangiales bacterium]